MAEGPTKSFTVKAAEPSRPGADAGGGAQAARVRWFLAAVVTFAASTALAFDQARSPSADPLDPPTGLGWFFSPIERNAERRLFRLQAGLRGVFALPGTELVWAVGDDGLILRSADGGDSWERQGEGLAGGAEGPLASLRDAFFFDDRTGWIAGDGGTVLRTTDGGATWTLAPPMRELVAGYPDDVLDLAHVRFVTPDSGWVAGRFGAYRSGDGGATWEMGRPIPPRGGDGLRGLVVQSGLDAWLSQGATVMRTGPDGVGFSYASAPETPWPSEVGSGGPADVWVVSSYGGGVQQGLRKSVLPEDYSEPLGILFRSTDGGAQWREHELPFIGDQLHVLDPATAWIVDEEGFLWGTRDGGVAWDSLTWLFPEYLDLQAESAEAQLYPVDEGPPLLASRPTVSFADPLRGYATFADGSLHVTGDAGRTWSRRTTPGLRAVTFVGREGWAVGDGGTVLHTSDAGRSWSFEESGVSTVLLDVDFTDPLNGWVMAPYEGVLHTTDGGRTWRIQSSDPGLGVRSAHFADATTGWAAGADGLVMRTGDGGASWTVVDVGPGALGSTWNVVSVSSSGAVGVAGTDLYLSSSGRPPWRPLQRSLDSPATDLLLPGQVGLPDLALGRESEPPFNTLLANVVGPNGMDWDVYDGVSQIRRAGSSDIEAVTVVAGVRWLAGREGRIYRSVPDAVDDPTLHATLDPPFDLYDLAPGPDGTIWAVGSGGTIVSARADDPVWADPRQHLSQPAPWYYVSWLLVLGLLLPALPRPRDRSVQRDISEAVASDRPLEEDDPDPLGFKSLAAGISRFLRNVSTEPPLTLAVTGPWGSGKSSLMNLIQADLRRRGFRPVWFNAWHHQKEEHLLASLLENVRKQGIPGVFSLDGITFRLRLISIRGWRDKGRILVLLGVLGVSMGVFAQHGESWLDTPQEMMEHAQDLLAAVPGGESADAEAGHPRFGRASVVAFGASFAWLLLGGLRGLVAFRLSPATLLASVSRPVRVKHFQDQLGFRHRFREEFSDVTRALAPRTMVVLIDDLDRCRPENVLEVLECVNFLSTCGDCFIVMGMDLDRVVRCVGLGFKDVAEEMPISWEHEAGVIGQPTLVPSSDSDAVGEAVVDEGRLRRARFATQYLEKLVNIEVPVPTPTPEQAQKVLKGTVDAPQPTGGFDLGPLLGPVARGVRTAWPVLVTALVMVVGYWIGSNAVRVDGGDEAPRVTVVGAPEAASAPGGGAPAVGGDAGASTTAGGAPTGPGPSSVRASAQSGESRSLPWAFALVPLLALLALGQWRLSIRANVVERDSDEFLEALDRWYPLLVSKRATPRSLKRFVNRVRYYSMLQGSSEATEPGSWPGRVAGSVRRAAADAGRLGRRLAGRGGAPPSSDAAPEPEPAQELRTAAPARADDGRVPESILVAFSAIQHFDPKWLDDDQVLSDLGAFLRERDDEVDPKIVDELTRAGDLPSLGAYEDRFRKLSAGVRVF